MKNFFTFAFVVITLTQLAILVNNKEVIRRQRTQVDRCVVTINDLAKKVEEKERTEVFLRAHLDYEKANAATLRGTIEELNKRLGYIETPKKVVAATAANDIQSLQNELLDALIHVESRGDSSRVGDEGKAIGCLQIHHVYWTDATKHSDIGGSYRDCTDPVYARRVVDAYMRHYAKEAWTNPKKFDPEKCARIHNGGPTGHKRSTTAKYWAKVARQLG